MDRHFRWLLLLGAGFTACAGGEVTPESLLGDGEGTAGGGGSAARGGAASSSSASGNAVVAGGAAATGSSSAAHGGGQGASPTVCGATPWIVLEGVPNARSLGGVPLANGATLACHKLYRGAYLSGLTSQGCASFAEFGIKTVIDLRSMSEQVVLPPPCVTEQANVVSAPMPVPYNVSPADYLADLYATAAIGPAFDALGDETAYPVYFHCLHGRDRSGVLAAVVLLALGATRDEVLAEYRLSEVAGYTTYPASLVAVLDEIEGLGGIDAFFAAMGIDASRVATMRRLLSVDAGA